MPDSEGDSSDTLAGRIRQGDRAAEEEFAGYYFPRVLTMARIRLRDAEVAQDIAQETLLSVLLSLREGKLRSAEALSAFVLGTARNILNSYVRSKSRRPIVEPLTAELVAPVNLTLELEERQRSARVRVALEGLKAVDRKILRLTLLEGMTPGEIAPLIGRSAENVRTRKSRAIKAIARRIEKVTRNATANHLDTRRKR